MRSELSALKLEVEELKMALVQETLVSQFLATELTELRCSNDTATPTERSYMAIAARKPGESRAYSKKSSSQASRTTTLSRKPTPTVSFDDRYGPASATTTKSNTSSLVTAPASPREMVRGAKRVWGTLPSTTVKNTISHLSQLSGENEIRVRRKFVSRLDSWSGKDKWSFVLHGSEDVL